MELKSKFIKLFVCVLVVNVFFIFIKVYVLDNIPIRLVPKLIVDRVMRLQPAGTPESTLTRYNNLLHYMGYSSMSGVSDNDLPNLERFFNSVRHFVVSSTERQWQIDLLVQLKHFCQQNNITFFLYYGGLVGAYRHHGIVPWDDDLDFLIPFSSKSKLKRLLRNSSILGYGDKNNHIVPIFLKDPNRSIPIKNRSWRWPYIEPHFYDVNGDTIVHHFETCGGTKVSDIFPLIEVPFENMTLPAPRRMDCLVNNCYPGFQTICCAHAYIHKTEMPIKEGSECIDCKLLRSVFPFVSHRKRHGDYVEEQVFVGSRPVSTKRVKKPLC